MIHIMGFIKKYTFSLSKLKTLVIYSKSPISDIFHAAVVKEMNHFITEQNNLFLFQICENFKSRALKSNLTYNDPIHIVST